MKKLLTTIFMAVLAVSAFATVNVETETPTVYHDGLCERVGSMRFIVTNDQDYQNATSDDPIIIQILLTDAAVLCHDLDGDDADGIVHWVQLEVDGTFWDNAAYPEVLARGGVGWNYIEVIIRDNPEDAGTFPSPQGQAWFRLGSTVTILGGVINPPLYLADFTPDGNKMDGTPICVNYTGKVGGADAFLENEFNVISLTTYLGVLGGTQLGVSYSPANPAIAYGGPVNVHNFDWDTDCGKSSNDLVSSDVRLCKCYEIDDTEQEDVFNCSDLYRIGTLNLQTNDCALWLEEDAIGMLPVGSIITMTVVDGAGNPLSTVDHGVYIADGPMVTLTPMLLSDDVTPAEIAVAFNALPPAYDSAAGGEYSMFNSNSIIIPLTGEGDCTWMYPTGQECDDLYNLYESVSWTVTAESQTEIGRLQVSDVNLARFTADGPETAYVKFSWAPYPCGAGGDKILPFPLNFVDCPVEGEVEPEYYPQWEYFTYFPAFSDGYWWAGVAVTNASFFAENFGVFPHFHTDQDAMVTYYAIEADGDVYMLDAGMLPESGILVTLLSDPALSWTYMGSNAGEVAFGDESFWLIVEGMPTVPWTYIWLDGFGMIGNGNEGQGTLPRVGYGPLWNDGIPYNK